MEQETAPEIKRDSNGRVLPGQSLNPGGRRGKKSPDDNPPVVADKTMIREFKKAIMEIPKLIKRKDVDAKTVVQALALMKDVIYGKKSALEAENNNGKSKKKSAIEAALDLVDGQDG